MITNALGLDLIKSKEGLASLKPNTDARNKKNLPVIANFKTAPGDVTVYPYIDSVGIKTIGYGHTLSFTSNPNAFKSGVTKDFCDKLFEKELTKYENGVKKYITSRLNPNQFSALVCFCYNLGIGSLQISSLRKEINKNPNNFEIIKNEWKKWDKAGGVVLSALTLRRLDEFKLYKTPYIQTINNKYYCDIADQDSTLNPDEILDQLKS